MAIYNNRNKDSAIATVEFAPMSDGNFTFFYIDNPRTDPAEIKKWLASPEMAQDILAETIVNNRRVLVTHGAKPKEEMLKLLEGRGDIFELKGPDRKINMWKWRGLLSMIGQPMQFLSGWNKKGERDYSIIVFAGLNMTANLINMVFGAQKSDDTHRLNLIKNTINDDLGEHVGTLDDLLKIDDKRADLRKGPEIPKTMGQQAYDFMQRNSVTLGEIGLRYLGGISLVAPMGRWAGGLKAIAKEKSLWAGLSHIKNPDIKTFNAGRLWLLGKTVAFFAKTPDPYNPEPKTTLDVIREKYLFKASTLSEMAGSTYLAVDRFKNPKRKIILGGKEYQDYLGGVGGLLFSTAFAMRLSAPFGVREVNMEEVYAHATDTLAKTPPEKLPQLMAESAATLKEHFKDKDIEFGEIFSKMLRDIYRYHHIPLENFHADAGKNMPAPVAMSETAPPQAMSKATLVAPRSALERATSPAASHAEAIKAGAQESQLGMGA